MTYELIKGSQFTPAAKKERQHETKKVLQLVIECQDSMQITALERMKN